MRIVIAGAGQVGITLAENLCQEHDITLIDTRGPRLKELANRLDIQTIKGSSSHPHILKEAQANAANMIIAVTSSDECNIVTCMLAHTMFNVPTKIARIRYRYIQDFPELVQMSQRFINMAINPAELVTERLKQHIQHPGTIVVLDLGGGLAKMASIKIRPDSDLIGRKLQEIKHDLDGLNCTICGYLRDTKMRIPNAETEIQAYDEIYFCARTKDILPITRQWLKSLPVYRHIMIAGAGNIGLTLAQSLEDHYHIKLLDRDIEQCETATKQLNRTVVLKGESSDTDLLQSERIDDVDLFCALTSDDEANMMSAIMAKRLGAKANIVLLNRQSYAHHLISSTQDIDMALSPERITGSGILKYVRKGDCVNIYSLPRGSAELLELIAHGDNATSAIVGKAVDQIAFPTGTKLCAIIRKDMVLMPSASEIVQPNDHLVIFVADLSRVPEIEELFAVSAEYI